MYNQKHIHDSKFFLVAEKFAVFLGKTLRNNHVEQLYFGNLFKYEIYI